MISQKYNEINGIKVFHPDINESHDDYNAKGLDSIYMAEEKHFWFTARKELIYAEMKNIIEIGTGNVSRFLKYSGYTNISVGEMHLNGLKYAKGYGILRSRYFFMAIIPLVYLRTILNKNDKIDVKDEEVEETISMSPLLNNILLFILRIENKINNLLLNLFGGSLFIIARKI